MKKTSIKKQFTTVTTLSKTLALLLFIALPFIGLYVGMQYGKMSTQLPELRDEAPSWQSPTELPTTYIKAVSWPPKMQVLQKPYTCTDPGRQIMLEKHLYCVTEESEGAAGSTYTTYTYTFPRNDTTIQLTFTLQAAQCANYDGAEKAACTKERATFKVDRFVDDLAHTIR